MTQTKEKKQNTESEWDKIKIIVFSVAIAILLVAGYMLKDTILGKSYPENMTLKNAAQGKINTDIKNSIQEQINSIKKEAGNINVVDIATSSPQVQKVINDLKALKEYPNNQLKQSCIKFCSNL